MTKVVLTKEVLKKLNSIPKNISKKFLMWVNTVEEIGIEETREIPGFHDEPLKGKRQGQRSIRLNRGYRAIYIINVQTEVLVEVIEVNKHDY